LNDEVGRDDEPVIFVDRGAAASTSQSDADDFGRGGGAADVPLLLALRLFTGRSPSERMLMRHPISSLDRRGRLAESDARCEDIVQNRF
jgi:hypothetical protein